MDTHFMNLIFMTRLVWGDTEHAVSDVTSDHVGERESCVSSEGASRPVGGTLVSLGLDSQDFTEFS